MPENGWKLLEFAENIWNGDEDDGDDTDDNAADRSGPRFVRSLLKAN